MNKFKSFAEKCKTMSCSDYANGLCPYSITNSMWKHGFDCYPIVPKISAPDIFIYLVETKNDKKNLEPIGLHTIVVAGHQFKLLYAKTLSSAPESSSGFRHIGSRRSKIQLELFDYISMDLDNFTCWGDDIPKKIDTLSFCTTQRFRFPFLSKLAFTLLSLQASSAPSEREFSIAGWHCAENNINDNDNEPQNSTTEQHYLEALGAYKGISSESQQAVGDGWVREFIAIALATQVVLMKAKVSTSQALSESPHKPRDLHKI
ncbi:hypothetical protein OUZ56_016217 [Daphnia magna]|uniref:HAT C-terminal dimerisation domain-containing protein n=1 Tax=Daphnia magna TaxID=35525 RepID=A0ABR0AQ50_9CRUS|nr:hypothetical protein OUZ56_016217 [Daphnia magna]